MPGILNYCQDDFTRTWWLVQGECADPDTVFSFANKIHHFPSTKPFRRLTPIFFGSTYSVQSDRGVSPIPFMSVWINLPTLPHTYVSIKEGFEWSMGSILASLAQSVLSSIDSQYSNHDFIFATLTTFLYSLWQSSCQTCVCSKSYAFF